jgi:hypothetical protein
MKDQHGGRDKPKTQLPLPIIVHFFLLLGFLQVIGEGETWLGHDNFLVLKKVSNIYNKHQVFIQVWEGEVYLECHGLN